MLSWGPRVPWGGGNELWIGRRRRRVKSDASGVLLVMKPWTLALTALVACSDATTPPPAADTLALEVVATGFANPLHLTAPANDPRLFIVEQPGRIRIVQNGQLLATPFLDIVAKV